MKDKTSPIGPQYYALVVVDKKKKRSQPSRTMVQVQTISQSTTSVIVSVKPRV
jgi:hypothetical protein